MGAVIGQIDVETSHRKILKGERPALLPDLMCERSVLRRPVGMIYDIDVHKQLAFL